MSSVNALMEFGMVPLLRVAWVAATLPILVALVPVRSIGFFRRLLVGFAARGKTLQSSTKLTVPQRFFLHFYVIAVLLTTSLVLSTWFYAYKKMTPLASEPLQFSTIASHLTGGSHMLSIHKSTTFPMKRRFEVWKIVLVLLMMEAQALRRLYETLYVFNYGPSARMHVLGYLAGLFFYTAAPLSVGSTCALEAINYVRSQIVEFIVKGRSRMPDVEFFHWEPLKPLFYLGWCQWFGAALFVWGSIHQLRCHAILGSLREQRGADEYIIPNGDWFEYVSCPHYLGEIVIYAGILLASGGFDPTVWLLFFFVVSNLVFAAAETHRWYHQKFESYPPSRKAIMPWIY
ncbi:hypothetical protein KFK09_019282 [Dendrobium nobile]|uniref:3-oxo-5-alpha-steroid 4-dehydrogenase C-terminal domain-containing protein n=1 Tax=Dendrobium nobile TaxID=94219 RepID=A0A8T3AYF0_DENNO|nr:hypothetical protein KFK09_019282 [Dendrobium nobile]